MRGIRRGSLGLFIARRKEGGRALNAGLWRGIAGVSFLRRSHDLGTEEEDDAVGWRCVGADAWVPRVSVCVRVTVRWGVTDRWGRDVIERRRARWVGLGRARERGRGFWWAGLLCKPGSFFF